MRGCGGSGGWKLIALCVLCSDKAITSGVVDRVVSADVGVDLTKEGNGEDGLDPGECPPAATRAATGMCVAGTAGATGALTEASRILLFCMATLRGTGGSGFCLTPGTAIAGRLPDLTGRFMISSLAGSSGVWLPCVGISDNEELSRGSGIVATLVSG